MSDNDLIRRGDVRELLQQCDLMGNHPSDPLAVMFNEIPAAQPTVSPKQLAAQPDDVAALVEAAENVLDTWYAFDSLTTGMHYLATALARVKGVM